MLQGAWFQIPAGAEDEQERYRSLAKQPHPDVGGSVEDFKVLKEATEAALKYLQSGRKSIPGQNDRVRFV